MNDKNRFFVVNLAAASSINTRPVNFGLAVLPRRLQKVSEQCCPMCGNSIITKTFTTKMYTKHRLLSLYTHSQSQLTNDN